MTTHSQAVPTHKTCCDVDEVLVKVCSKSFAFDVDANKNILAEQTFPICL